MRGGGRGVAAEFEAKSYAREALVGAGSSCSRSNGAVYGHQGGGARALKRAH